jgi:hypothetical protein
MTKPNKNKKKSSKSDMKHDKNDHVVTSDYQKQHDNDGNIHDERFIKAQTHPQFQKLHTRNHPQEGSSLLVATHSTLAKQQDMVDERFKAILTDPRFAMGGDVGIAEGAVDRYGKVQKKKSEKTKGFSSGSDVMMTQEKSNEGNKNEQVVEWNPKVESDIEEEDVVHDDPESRIAYLTALSRGEMDVLSSSDDDDEEEDDDDDVNNHHHDEDKSTTTDSTESEDSLYGKAGVLDPSNKDSTLQEETEIIFEASRFLAICNMDWNSVRAVDLFAMTSSFAPPGSVKCVKVYPSDFGKQRMELDATLGPKGIWKKKKRNDEQISGDGIMDHDDDYDDGSNDNDGSYDDDDGSHDDNDQEENDNDDQDDDESEDDDDNDQEDDDDDDDEEEEEHEFNDEIYQHFHSSGQDESTGDDFDAEKLRAYEASKLKYYFAVVEFTSSDAADIVYKELDGMEIGHSSSCLDLRAIPEEEVPNVIEGRELRDQASMLPSNYSPPDFVVAALQQTAVKCTWEEGDKERERLLTQYGVGNDAWQALTEGDDLKAYLASDVSSDDESDVNDETLGKKEKAKTMRALLGLDDSEHNSSDRKEDEAEDDNDDEDSFFNSHNLESDNEDEAYVKEATFIPGKSNFEEKIRSKLQEKSKNDKEMTPWEKYQQKRKEKRKEKKMLKKQQQSLHRDQNVEDESVRETSRAEQDENSLNQPKPSTIEELDLLLAGDRDEEAAKDFHMRDVIRIEKNRAKKLRGSRKRKEEEIRNNAVGLDFKLDTKDSRFAAVLDGTDDRFGIDRTDPQFKETPAMRELLAEQTKRRKANKRAKSSTSSQDISAEAIMAGESKSTGADALSSLVKNLVSKVSKNKM